MYLSLPVVLLSLVVAFLYHPTQSPDALSHIVPNSGCSTDTNAHILLLTAHPDDECMFFAPTIQALTRQPHPNGCHSETTKPKLHTLCLSIGNADGLGTKRREELNRSLDVLGIEEANRMIIDHPNLKDDLTSDWDPTLIMEILYPYINENQISTILTFDRGGISGHPNHRSLPEGVKHLHHNQNLSVPVPRLFTLVTRPIATKYTSILAPLGSKLTFYQRRFLSLIFRIFRLWMDPASEGSHPDVGEQELIVSAGIREYLTALRAMREHKSQLVWFRWLYLSFSSYMWVNEWVEIRVGDLD